MMQIISVIVAGCVGCLIAFGSLVIILPIDEVPEEEGADIRIQIVEGFSGEVIFDPTERTPNDDDGQASKRGGTRIL